MKQQLKLLAVVLGAAIALIATVFSAFASPNLGRANVSLAAPLNLTGDAAPLAACTTMEASDVAWVTLTEDGDIDEQVEVYPSGTTLITPVFEYNCVPKKVTIVTVFTLDEETVFTDKEPLRTSNNEGLYGYPLGTTDESPMDDGEWGVEFYNSKTLLTSGTIVVGEDGGNGGQPSADVTVQGTVTDKKTKKPIKNAVILILEPGVTIQDFIDGGQKDADVYTAAKTDSKGLFALEDTLERGTEYSIIVVAKGYKPTGVDGFVIGDDDPDPLDLTITMTK